MLDICEALDLHDVIFVGHSVSSMIGVLAANAQPERFATLIMVGPSPRYINDAPDYVGGFERSDIEGLLETMDKNYIGWANFLAPALMQNADRPELGAQLTEGFLSTGPVHAQQSPQPTSFPPTPPPLPRALSPSHFSPSPPPSAVCALD